MENEPLQGPRTYSIEATEFEAPALPPGLYLVATPIGHLADMTIRGLMTLAAADAILCEDTRVTAKLLARYAIRTRLSPYHEHNAAKVRPGLLRRLKDAAALALVSDAGMPLISDPGYRLVREAAAAGIAVTVCPGPSAVLAGLCISGLPTDRFSFLGFVPSKAGDRQRLFAEFASVRSTLIFFESPHRIAETLREIESAWPGRDVAVTRELTKLHEEILRGSPGEVRQQLAARAAVKGEITLIVAPPADVADATDESVDAAITAALRTLPPGKAAAEVAKALKLNKAHVYQRIIASKAGHD